MEKHIADERTGLKYELVGDYYLIVGEDEPEQEPIGILGQRHLHYLKRHRKTVYASLLTSGKLNAYLADVDRQAEAMFERSVQQIAASEGITEQLKAVDQLKCVSRMNNVRNRAMEIVNTELIFA